MAADITADQTDPAAAPKKSRKPLLFGLILALLGGGGGYYAVGAGLIPGLGATQEEGAPEARDLPPFAFVPLDPMVISLEAQGRRQLLRFRAQLEVPPEYQAEVAMLTPRIIDVLNGYLRAVEVSELGDPAALIRLRAQMLRRIRIVVGDGRVRDLLIMEFVLD